MRRTIFAVSILLLTFSGWHLTSALSKETGDKSVNRGQFALIDHTGQPVSDQDFSGSYLLIFFGYTHCPDICPTALTILGNTMDQLGPRAQDVQPLFITLDPERDTYEILANFVPYFHPRLIGLTGSLDAIKAVQKTYFVRSQKYNLGAESSNPANKTVTNYLLDHTAASYLLGTNGNGLALFHHGTPASEIVDTILHFIARDAFRE